MDRELVSNRSLFIVVCGPIRTPEGSLQLERKPSYPVTLSISHQEILVIGELRYRP